MSYYRTSDNNFGVAKWIVDSTPGQGTHLTLTDALADASSGDTIFVRPGTYTEDINMKAGVNISAFGSDGITPAQAGAVAVNVIIHGTTTAAYSGQAAISGIQLRTNGGPALSMTGANLTSITFEAATIYGFDDDVMAISNVNSTLNFYQCTILTEAGSKWFDITTTSGVDFENCTFNGSGDTGTITAGRVVFQACDMPAVTLATTSIGTYLVNGCNTGHAGLPFLTTAGIGVSEIFSTYINSGTASAISIGSGTAVTMANCAVNSSNTNAITGAGTLNYGNVVFVGASSNVNVTTQNGFPLSIRQGGSNAQTFAQTNGVVAYNGTSLVNYAALQVSSGGVVTNTSQPSFSAYLATSVPNATGDGTDFQLGTTTALTENFDRGNNFNTNGTYTAPATGVHFLGMGAIVSNLGALHVESNTFITTTGRIYNGQELNPFVCKSGTEIAYNNSCLAFMTAGDTATAHIIVSGSTKTVTVNGGANNNSYFFGTFIG